jgi:hypothetical protein
MSSNLDAKVGGSTKQYESRNKTANMRDYVYGLKRKAVRPVYPIYMGFAVRHAFIWATAHAICGVMIIHRGYRCMECTRFNVVSNTHEFHPKLKTRNRQFSRYMKLICSESP